MDAIDAVSQADIDAVMTAARRNDAPALRALSHTVDLRNARGRGERTPLMEAAASDSADTTRDLLPLSDFDATDESGHTALHLAACARSVECIRLLLPFFDRSKNIIN